MENEVTRYNAVPVNFDEQAMPIERLVAQVSLIQQVMGKVMKNGEHYGVIPGCKKPSLLKPGAEKLSTTFRLSPSYNIAKSDLPGAHREYEVVCTLTHITTGQIVGQGVGSCSTMEGKYRFRTGEGELTAMPVPKAYWDNRDIKILKKLANEAGIEGDKFSTKKDTSGKWFIATFGERVEHDNPADYYNTVLKMAKKRAHVDAVLTATAASDIFTQDVEDMTEVIPGAASAAEKATAQVEFITAEQSAEITKIITEVYGKDASKFFKYMEVETVSEITDYKKAMFAIEAYKKAKKQ